MIPPARSRPPSEDCWRLVQGPREGGVVGSGFRILASMFKMRQNQSSKHILEERCFRLAQEVMNNSGLTNKPLPLNNKHQSSYELILAGG